MRARVTVVAALAVAAGLAVAAVLLVLSLEAGLRGGLDDAAQARAAVALAAAVRGDLTAAVASSSGDSGQVQVLAPDGRVLAASPVLADRGPLAPPLPDTAQRRSDGTIDERDVRLFTQSRDGLTVVVGTPLSDLQESVAALVRRLLVGGPVLLGLICAAIWLLVGYPLHTVERLRGQVAELSAAGLDRRVELPVARDEVRALAVTMNELLGRLQRSAQAQRRFVADAAHELRSPVAALRTRLEVNVRGADLQTWVRTAPVMVSDTERLARLVDDLLALSRLDESLQPRSPVLVDLDEVVRAEVDRVRGTTTMVLDTRGVGAGLVRGDEDLLGRVVANLLANAVRHAVSRVRVAVTTSDRQVELTVADDGPGIPVEERERVFERFRRLDAARARDGGGSGLGLAIVRDAVRAHGGTVTVQDAGPGALLTIWLPGAEH